MAVALPQCSHITRKRGIYTTERHLLYVAATRARERLLLTGVDLASEFLTDLGGRTGR